jgi:glycosyltransferase involved in cell wall biosynthesis
MGGMERASSTLANEFDANGYKVYLLLLFKRKHFFQVSPAITVIEPEGFNSSSFSFLNTLKFIRDNVKSINPNATLVYGKFYGALSMLSTLGLKSKIFISERSSPLLKWPIHQRVFNKIAFFLKKPSGAIAQTSVAKELQSLYYGDRVPISIIPNAIRNVELYPEIKRQKIILSAGRPNDPLKGFDRLIDAYSLIKNKDWKLVILGGAGDIGLERQVKSLELEAHVDLLEKSGNVDQWFAKAGIYVIASRSEGFPNVLCEAMLSGLACISFDFIAGPSDIIANNIDGILVKNGDIDALAVAMDGLISDQSKRKSIGLEARESRCKLDNEQLFNLYKNTLKL